MEEEVMRLVMHVLFGTAMRMHNNESSVCCRFSLL